MHVTCVLSFALLIYSLHVGYCPFLLFSSSFSVLKRAPPLFVLPLMMPAVQLLKCLPQNQLEASVVQWQLCMSVSSCTGVVG